MRGQAIARQRLSGGCGERPETLWRTVDHCDRRLGSDAPPILPAMKLRKIISAHDPDEAQAGSAAAQVRDGIDSVTDADDSFETADVDARIVCHFSRGIHPRVEGVQCVL